MLPNRALSTSLYFRPFILFTLWAALAGCAAPPDDPLPTLMQIETASEANPAAAASPTAQPLAFWTPVTGQLDGPDDRDLWRFEARAGDAVTLRVIGTTAQPTLQLFDPLDSPLVEGDTVRAVLARDGAYTVVVRASEADRYELGLRYTDQPNPLAAATPLPQIVGVPTPAPFAELGEFIAAIDDEQTLGGAFSAASPDAPENHVYTFDGAAGEYITLELNRVSGDDRPILTLFDTTGAPLALDQASGENGALLRNVRLPVDGVYSAQARGAMPGGYALRLLKAVAPAPVTPTVIITPTTRPETPVLTPTLDAARPNARLRPYALVRGELRDPDDLARHSFYAEQGAVITFGLRPEADSALIPRVELIDPEGVPVAVVSGNTSPTNRDAVISAFAAATTGTYTAFVTAEGESFGAYIAGYGQGSTWQDIMRGEAPFDRENASAIRAQGVRDIWYAVLLAGDLITASVVPLAGDLAPVLEIVAPDGTLIGIDREGGGPRAPRINGLRIPANGAYQFRVWAAQPQTRGDYALIWQYLDVAPTPTPPTGTLPVLTLRDRVPDQAYRFYPFQGQAGQRVRVRVIADPPGNFDPVAALLDPTAQVVAEGDDGVDGDLNPQFETALPADGTYSVRVNGYQTGGSFTLIVETLY